MTNNAPNLKIEGTASIGTKGQIVIPKNVRNKFDFNPWDDLIVLSARSATILIKSENLEDMMKQFEEISKLYKNIKPKKTNNI